MTGTGFPQAIDKTTYADVHMGVRVCVCVRERERERERASFFYNLENPEQT